MVETEERKKEGELTKGMEQLRLSAEPKKPSGDKGMISKGTGKKKQRVGIDDFLILTTLGTGTFGRVRLVRQRDQPDLPPMALKMLKKREMIRLKQVLHVQSEKSILEEINHPFIIKLLNTFQNIHYVFMLLDYVCGGEVFNRLRKEGRFANDVALFYTTEIILAFEYMHSKDITYRDLKPENLLIDREGHIKITDFGFAKKVTDKTYTLCGTPEYLAPEIIQGQGHDKSVDWWAIGVLLFEMLAGYPPFYDDHPMGIYRKILEGYYEIPRVIRPKARDLIRQFLSADRTMRLGCLKGGSEDVKAHKWFRGVDWDMVFQRQIPPPWKPRVKSDTDTHYFDKYPDSVDPPATPSHDEQDLFKHF